MEKLRFDEDQKNFISYICHYHIYLRIFVLDEVVCVTVLVSSFLELLSKGGMEGDEWFLNDSISCLSDRLCALLELLLRKPEAEES